MGRGEVGDEQRCFIESCHDGDGEARGCLPLERAILDGLRLRCQFGTSSSTYGGRRYLPYVFTENGVAMLSSVLSSDRAIEINISIMRIFTKLRSFHALESNITSELKMTFPQSLLRSSLSHTAYSSLS